MSAGRVRPGGYGPIPAVVAVLAVAVVACGDGGQGTPSPDAATSTSPPSAVVTPSSETVTSEGPTASPDAPVPGPEPVGVVIPAIEVESPLLHLGLRPDGSAEVPDEFDLASWYRHGGRPGGRGPTVVLGHVDSVDGPAVFARLHQLTPGDEIEVTLADGSVAVYAVTGSIEFHKDAVPTAEVFGATTDDVLRLITCSGPFDRRAASYTENLVVNAERVGT